jgi:ADP-ribosylglycohydrolase
MDTWMLDTLSRTELGSPEEPVNHFATPGAITASLGVGLFFRPEAMDQAEMDRLGAESVALTHGSPLAFLPGAVVAHLVNNCLLHPDIPLKMLIQGALAALKEQFSREYPAVVSQITTLVNQAVSLAEERITKPVDAMEQLGCNTGAEVLSGALYAALLCEEDFDNAMVIAVNHSGRSAAVGSLTGAILGARMGAQALPDFYMDGLYIADVLRDLADDLMHGCPMVRGNLLFDGDWESKYLHGEY